MKLKLVAGNMSDDARLCFTCTDWVDKEYPATLSDEATAAIAKAREYLASTTPYNGTYCRFVSLQAAGLDTAELDAAMTDNTDDGSWCDGLTDLRAFPGKGIFYYIQNDDNAAAWVEFEVLNENGEAI